MCFILLMCLNFIANDCRPLNYIYSAVISFFMQPTLKFPSLKSTPMVEVLQTVRSSAFLTEVEFESSGSI